MISFDDAENIKLWFIFSLVFIPLAFLIIKWIKRDGKKVSFTKVCFTLFGGLILWGILFLLSGIPTKKFMTNVWVIQKTHDNYQVEHFLSFNNNDFKEYNLTKGGGANILLNQTSDTIIYFEHKCDTLRENNDMYKIFNFQDRIKPIIFQKISPNNAIYCNKLDYKFSFVPQYGKIKTYDDENKVITIIDIPDSLFKRNETIKAIKAEKITKQEGNSNAHIILWIIIFIAVVIYLINDKYYGEKVRDEFYDNYESAQQEELEQMDSNINDVELHTFNGCGRKFCGEFRNVGNTYATYYCRVLGFVPITVFDCYRVEKIGKREYKIYGKIPSQRKEIINLLIKYWSIAVIIIALMGFIKL